MKEFEELSTKLEFDGFDDTVTDGQSEGRVTNRSLPEEADEGGRGEEDVEDRKSESKPRMETKPLAADECRWPCKVSDPSSLLVTPY